MARAVTKVLELWKVDDEAACRILALGTDGYSRWKCGVFNRIDDDASLRLVTLISIYTSLRIMFTDPRRGWAWMQRPNVTFQGQCPLDVLARGDLGSMRRMRAYLEAEARG
ncbi:DUF2384 domain-containing protein [Bosea sp. LjRoot9]|uniref:antitoxin Xre/MbcA/ParS toxin-binding domain-containing protein n=1 Tax=Bosea sp. LjRoot9 TaxID=3342341 RepID=UPI003ECCDE82